VTWVGSNALINRDFDVIAKAAKVGLRLKGETRVRGKRGIGTQYLEHSWKKQ